MTGTGYAMRPLGSVPSITAEQMREVDGLATGRYGILLVQMMENAGLHLAELVSSRFDPRSVTVLCGPGGNGGGGLVAARHLSNRGVAVTTTVSDSDRLGDVPRHQLDLLERIGVPVTAEPVESEVVIDALIGYSLHGDPTGRAAELIRWANGSAALIFSLDVPSGLDPTTGRVHDPCVLAAATMTLALPKVGLAGAAEVVGELYLADISIPPALHAELGILVDPIFASGSIIRLL
jgi:NAD(P)H-hydrate epimerase